MPKTIIFHKTFKKDYKKLTDSQQQAYKKRFRDFIEDHTNPILRDHHLQGKMRDRRAFSVTGNIRVIYKYQGEESLVFLRIGPHNKVY